MLLSLVTAHKITTFRCKYLATMATGDDDDENEDGATTTTKILDDGEDATGDGIQRRWWWTTSTMRLMATARRATMMATLVIIIVKLIILLICLHYNFYRNRLLPPGEQTSRGLRAGAMQENIRGGEEDSPPACCSHRVSLTP
jgi:hypothetical protein